MSVCINRRVRGIYRAPCNFRDDRSRVCVRTRVYYRVSTQCSNCGEGKGLSWIDAMGLFFFQKAWRISSSEPPRTPYKSYDTGQADYFVRFRGPTESDFVFCNSDSAS